MAAQAERTLGKHTYAPRGSEKGYSDIKITSFTPPQKKRQKAFFTLGDFFRPAFIIQACFSEEMEKCELDFLRNLDLFSVVRNLLVPFTACPANVTDSPALQCQHNYPAYSLFRLQSGTTTIRGRRSCMCRAGRGK